MSTIAAVLESQLQCKYHTIDNNNKKRTNKQKKKKKKKKTYCKI